MRKRYLDVMEQAVRVYSPEQIEAYRARGIYEHGFPRLVANLLILTANGRMPERADYAAALMTDCCHLLPKVPSESPEVGWVGKNFAVKELVLALLEAERAGRWPAATTAAWRQELASLIPEHTYNSIAASPTDRVNNWAAFAAVSEQLRLFAGIGDERAFIDRQVGSQLQMLDENGMYRDPGEPLVYDIVTRLQLLLLLAYGYDGAYREELERRLRLARPLTLRMQSVTGEIPFGGRSNQFLHNEASFASLCEIEAVRCKREGDLALAGQFRQAARLAVESVERWLATPGFRHIKNFYPREDPFGCEGYGYFNKYMVTLASMIYPAFALADESIPEAPCPAAGDGAAAQTSPHFHKVFWHAGDWFLEFDTAADPHYDANGLGRIHHRGAPAVLCLSVPCPAQPAYHIGEDSQPPLAVAPAVYDGAWHSGAAGDWAYTLTRLEQSGAAFACTRGDQPPVQWEITAGGTLTLRVSGTGMVGLTVPLLQSDGAETAVQTHTPQVLTVTYRGFRCRYETTGRFEPVFGRCANRNGRYDGFIAVGDTAVTVTCCVERA